MNAQRLAKVRVRLEQEGLDALLVTEPNNRRYMSGFTGTSGMVVITPQKAWLITDFRYIEQASQQAPLFEVVEHHGDAVHTLKQLLHDAGAGKLGFDAQHLTYAEYVKLVEALQPIQLVSTSEWVERLRWIKEPEEIDHIRKAAVIADEAFRHVLTILRPGIKERDVAAELEYKMRQLGASGPAFDTIVASGPRSALPHGVAGERVLTEGDLVTLDFGARYEGYCSDLTRTVAIGSVDARLQEIFRIVLEAQELGLSRIRAGMTGREADAVVRDYISARGYGAAFGHATGHAIGLDIHESPSLSKRCETVLEPGMVLTVEPGIYLPGLGGVRIEDDVLVTADGLEVLTGAPKHLIVL
ncbi:MAG: Xaa-Pro dipeptidase [Bacillaceae bacterium G1]|nr:Xaa-Pro dipeptidase [Bacillota bacterium]OJF17010.1 MAG: Xaa-Pro dipeptidase [Bacillaceae bacterium G1]